MNKNREYEVEFRSVTWRTFSLSATSPEEAEAKAWEELENDLDASKAWKANAEIISIEDMKESAEQIQKN
jgi:hypothetical protein